MRLANVWTLLPLCLLAWPAIAQPPPSAWEMLSTATRQVPTELPARAAWAVAPRLDSLRDGSASLRIALPSGDREVLMLEVEQHAGDRFTWRGSLDGSADYQVVLSVAGDAVAGFISAPEGIWELVPSTVKGESWLIELDADRLPPCRGPIDPGPDGGGSVAKAEPSEPGLRDSGERVDVLLMYSPAARDAAGGVNQITAQAQAAVDSANTVFANSGMRMRFRAVSIELLEGWVEGTASASTELGSFRSNATQQGRRNALAADMVSLLVANLPSACGIGYVMRSPSAGFASSAVQITDRDCAVGNLSWAHEHGHNLGFEHDPANGTAPTSASYPWGFVTTWKARARSPFAP
jgi:hypothetical protein